MLVIADSSPLIVLVNIGQIDVLPKLFKEVVIPPAVASELTTPARPQIVRDFAAAFPPWLRVQAPTMVQQIAELHRGESEALSLAMELHADLVLIGGRQAYREAVARKLNAVGTVRVLERAAAEGLIDLNDTFNRLKQTDFWISHALLDARLKLFQKEQRPKKP